MADQRVYHAPGIDLDQLGQQLDQYFAAQDFETQLLGGGGSTITVQARQRKDWRHYVGGSVALSVTVTPQGENVLVQMGAAKWADKVVGGVAALILFWPLAALPAWGAYKQKQIIDDTFTFIDRYVASGAPVAPVSRAPAPAASSTHESREKAVCPSCGAAVAIGAKFCPNCGAKHLLVCSECGHALNPGAKFCENCGAKTG